MSDELPPIGVHIILPHWHGHCLKLAAMTSDSEIYHNDSRVILIDPLRPEPPAPSRLFCVAFSLAWIACITHTVLKTRNQYVPLLPPLHLPKHHWLAGDH